MRYPLFRAGDRVESFREPTPQALEMPLGVEQQLNLNPSD
jgi:hypothetical protein